MSKFATKAAANMFCQARYEAAKSNERLSSREGAAEEIGIDRTRLARIELGSTIPYQEEVLLICFNFSCMKRAIEKSKFNSTFLEEAMEIQRMISCGVIMLMIDTTTISIVCWAIPDLFDRIGCDVLIFFHGIEQVFTNWQTPTIFSASDCKGIINNFLPTIHEVYQSAQRGCCMVRSINMDMDTT